MLTVIIFRYWAYGWLFFLLFTFLCFTVFHNRHASLYNEEGKYLKPDCGLKTERHPLCCGLQSTGARTLWRASQSLWASSPLGKHTAVWASGFDVSAHLFSILSSPEFPWRTKDCSLNPSSPASLHHSAPQPPNQTPRPDSCLKWTCWWQNTSGDLRKLPWPLLACVQPSQKTRTDPPSLFGHCHDLGPHIKL